MTPLCSQSLENGRRCNAPAITGSRFCRHHDPQRPARPVVEEKACETEPLVLPTILDKQSALAALNLVVQALAEGRTKCSVAQTLLSAIKFAARLIHEIAEAGETVSPAASYSRPKAAPLAAPNDRSKPPLAFNPARRFNGTSPAYSSEVDSGTDRMIKEILAQSHQLAKTQELTAKNQML